MQYELGNIFFFFFTGGLEGEQSRRMLIWGPCAHLMLGTLRVRLCVITSSSTFVIERNQDARLFNDESIRAVV